MRLWKLLLEAYERQAWKAMGYPSWREYAMTEFNMSQRRAYQILDQGRVILALEEAVSSAKSEPLVQNVDVTERGARIIKPHLETVKAEIAERVTQGATVQEAVDAVVVTYRVKPSLAPEDESPDVLDVFRFCTCPLCGSNHRAGMDGNSSAS